MFAPSPPESCWFCRLRIPCFPPAFSLRVCGERARCEYCASTTRVCCAHSAPCFELKTNRLMRNSQSREKKKKRKTRKWIKKNGGGTGGGPKQKQAVRVDSGQWWIPLSRKTTRKNSTPNQSKARRGAQGTIPPPNFSWGSPHENPQGGARVHYLPFGVHGVRHPQIRLLEGAFVLMRMWSILH